MRGYLTPTNAEVYGILTATDKDYVILSSGEMFPFDMTPFPL